MRESPAGTTPASVTDWSRHDAPSMWRMLAPQATESHWRHASGLRKLTELTATHMARLQVYRDELAEAWPPEKSGAAKTFIARLDYLIDHVRKTHDVAAGNYTALTTATTTLESARKQVASIHAEYAEKLETRKTYDALVESTKASQLPGTVLGPSPVTDADFEHLNAKSRAVMSDLSQTLVLAQRQFRSPAPFGVKRREGWGPPIAATPAPARVQVQAPPVSTAASPRSAETRSAEAWPAGALAPGRADVRSQRSLSGGQFPARPGMEASSGFIPGRRLSPPLVPQAASTSSVVGKATAPRNVPTPGVIVPTSAPLSAIVPRRPEVSSGMIAPRSESPAVAPPLGAAPVRARKDEKSVTRRLNADCSWETPQGVPPVLLPPTLPTRIDPGPAIGLDR